MRKGYKVRMAHGHSRNIGTLPALYLSERASSPAWFFKGLHLPLTLGPTRPGVLATLGALGALGAMGAMGAPDVLGALSAMGALGAMVNAYAKHRLPLRNQMHQHACGPRKVCINNNERHRNAPACVWSPSPFLSPCALDGQLLTGTIFGRLSRYRSGRTPRCAHGRQS